METATVVTIETVKAYLATLNNGGQLSPSDIAKQFVGDAAVFEMVIGVAGLLTEVKRLSDSLDIAQLSNKNARKEAERVQQKVRAAFSAQIKSNKDSAQFDLEDANDLLENIGADELSFTYMVTVTSTVVINGIEADDADEAERLAYHAVNMKIDLDSLGDEAVIDSEEQETSQAEFDNN